MKVEDNFQQCVKCTICNDWCPLKDVVDAYPGPKQAGPDGERYRLLDNMFFDKALDFCLNCKRCEVACPSDVKIGDIILKARMKYGNKHHVVRNFILASTDMMGSLGTTFAPIANTAANVILPHGGPRYAKKTFEKMFRESAAAEQEKFGRQVSYFHGCYVNYNNPQLGFDLVKVLNALGVGVQLLEGENCCGIAMMSNCFEKKARSLAAGNLAALRRSLAAGRPVVSTSSTCTFTIRDEYPDVLGLDNSDVRDSMLLAVKYIYELLQEGGAKLHFKEGIKMKIAYHTPCHMAKLGWNIYSLSLLEMIPGVELIKLDENCCGIAGTYGFKPENAKVSKIIGKKLFDQIAAVAPDIVATDCETCRWQLEMNTPFKVLNPISILADAIE